MAQGKRVGEALAITPEQLSRELGTVPPEKMYCCQLAVATLRKALRSRLGQTVNRGKQRVITAEQISGMTVLDALDLSQEVRRYLLRWLPEI